ncbi:MAG TPA: TetR/AcrR family transcriptional regulator [Aldersonia sp.]
MGSEPSGPATRSLPRAVELAWGLGEPGTRGPRRGMTLEQILDAAVAVADAEGFAALSMSRLAKELGYTTMSLYRYVDSKDTLVQLLMDYVLGPPPPIDPDLPWRDALRAWAMGEFEAIMAHPWWLEIGLSAPPTGPNNMAWLEVGLAAMGKVDLPESLKFQLVMNVSLFVIGRTRVVRELVMSDPKTDAEFGDVMAQVLDPDRFPAITAALSAAAFDQEDPHWESADFQFGLDRLLDGYERYVADLADTASARHLHAGERDAAVRGE